jgi:hypothetical protein
MRTLTTLAIALLFFGFTAAHAQTATPSTTLCAAVTATATSVCLTSTTGVVNQTGIYVDAEYMTVTLANNQTLAASNAYVPVTRGNRAGAGPPSAHISGALAWLALGPNQSVVPGANGFIYDTQLGDVGPCVRSQQTYLPHIWPNRNVIRDCNYGGFWVDYNAGTDASPSTNPVSLMSGTGTVALGVQSGNYIVTKGSAWTATLAAPTAGVQDGMIIRITSATAFAHTVTATSLFQTGAATNATTATFAAFGGAGMTIMAYNGKWLILSSNGVTFS